MGGRRRRRGSNTGLLHWRDLDGLEVVLFSSLFVSASHGVDAVSSPGIGLSVEEWGWVGAGWGRGQGSRHWGLWSGLGLRWGHGVWGVGEEG